ncbi:MAG: hypothetical protein AB1489_42490, partial [Acidobacteriota bacterium]
MVKDLLRALSLSNLCFITTWSILITKSLSARAQWERYSFNSYLGIIINVLTLALLFWLAITFVRRSKNETLITIARCSLLFVLAIIINGIIQTQFLGNGKGHWGTDLAIIIVVLPALRFHRHIAKAAASAILVMFPFTLITFGQAIWLMTQFKEKGPAPVLTVAGKKSPHIVWMLFDEMDQRLAFSQRPETLKMPETDRLVNEAIFATNAYPP